MDGFRLNQSTWTTSLKRRNSTRPSPCATGPDNRICRPGIGPGAWEHPSTRGVFIPVRPPTFSV